MHSGAGGHLGCRSDAQERAEQRRVLQDDESVVEKCDTLELVEIFCLGLIDLFYFIATNVNSGIELQVVRC